MSEPDYSSPPRDLPVYVRYLLGLPQDSTLEEIRREWANQVVPLMNIGPQHLFDREAVQLMGGGLSGIQARRVFKQTKRGAFLAGSAERESVARERSKRARPPFARTTH